MNPGPYASILKCSATTSSNSSACVFSSSGFLFFAVLETEFSSSHMLGKHSITELHTQPINMASPKTFQGDA